MSTYWLIATDEIRYWRRSRLALWSTILFMSVLLATVLITTTRIETERNERMHHQQEAEQTFLDQPARHPHRMVHYGHYVYRTPTPLALFDPGLDPVTGQSIFLEGHRQNSAMFSDNSASADFGGLSRLTPASVYQLLAPLLIVLLAHGAVAREREAGALATLWAQGVSGTTLLAGKGLALIIAVALVLTPILISGLLALTLGESPLALLTLLAVYFLYLSIWSLLSLVLSAFLQQRSTVLAMLTAMWLASALLLPSLAVNNAAQLQPMAGKIETDFEVQKELRKLGDGHNADDPAFQKLRADLLARYEVDNVEDLPVNLRGVVASESEAQLTELLNEFAAKQMRSETAQAGLLHNHGWLAPTLAVARASRAVAGTSLEDHHRFLREAEALRFEFIQGLNKVHAEQLSYIDDINRSNGEEGDKRSRVDASNWQVLNDFRFEAASAQQRLATAGYPTAVLAAWCLALAVGVFVAGARLRP
ncbi:MAG: DUF3526 domain-containing protein [Pseudomonadota bacterium]